MALASALASVLVVVLVLAVVVLVLVVVVVVIMVVVGGSGGSGGSGRRVGCPVHNPGPVGLPQLTSPNRCPPMGSRAGLDGCACLVESP